MADLNSTSYRSFYCADALWQTFSEVSLRCGRSVDALINEAMALYLKTQGIEIASDQDSSELPSESPSDRAPQTVPVPAQVVEMAAAAIASEGGDAADVISSLTSESEFSSESETSSASEPSAPAVMQPLSHAIIQSRQPQAYGRSQIPSRVLNRVEQPATVVASCLPEGMPSPAMRPGLPPSPSQSSFPPAAQTMQMPTPYPPAVLSAQSNASAPSVPAGMPPIPKQPPAIQRFVAPNAMTSSPAQGIQIAPAQAAQPADAGASGLGQRGPAANGDLRRPPSLYDDPAVSPNAPLSLSSLEQVKSVPIAPPQISVPQNSNGIPPLYIIFANKRYLVDKDKYIIGRSSQLADLVIRDTNISRKHCAVIYKNGSFYIKDLDSTNGIEYKGNRIDAKRIEEGDQFNICEFHFTFTYR